MDAATASTTAAITRNYMALRSPWPSPMHSCWVSSSKAHSTRWFCWGTISAVLIIAIYICTGISCIVFYRREHRHEINPLLHIVIPFVGSIAFIPVLLAAFGIDFAGLGITSLAWPANYA